MSNISLFTPIQFSPTSFDNLHITGSGVAPTSTVSVYKNGTLLGTSIADSNGYWSYTLSTPAVSGDVYYYSAVPITQSVVVKALAGPWTLNRIVNVAGGGTSISATGMSYSAISVPNVPNVWKTTYSTMGYLCTIMLKMGWNYTPPRGYAVSGTTLAQDLAIYNGTSTLSSATSIQRWGAIGSDGWHPDIFLLEGGGNDIVGSRTYDQMVTDSTAVENYIVGLNPKPKIPLLLILPHNNFTNDAAMQAIRTQFNTWRMTQNSYDPNIYPYDASFIFEDPANLGHMLANMSNDGVHPNPFASLQFSSYAYQQLSNNGLLPAPKIFPYALDAASDPTNLLQHAISTNNAVQLFNVNTGTATNMASGSVAPKGFTLSAGSGLEWSTSAGAQPSSSLVLDTGCTTRNKLVITIPTGNAPGSQATALADAAKTWISLSSSSTPLISTTRANNYDGSNTSLAIGNTYRAGIKVKINSPNCFVGGFTIKYKVDGVSVQTTSFAPIGAYNPSEVYPAGTYDIISDLITIPAFTTSIELTQISLIMAFCPGMSVGGSIEISGAYIRPYVFIPSWP